METSNLTEGIFGLIEGNIIESKGGDECTVRRFVTCTLGKVKLKKV
jgi:hypothetical protein